MLTSIDLNHRWMIGTFEPSRMVAFCLCYCSAHNHEQRKADSGKQMRKMLHLPAVQVQQPLQPAARQACTCKALYNISLSVKQCTVQFSIQHQVFLTKKVSCTDGKRLLVRCYCCRTYRKPSREAPVLFWEAVL